MDAYHNPSKYVDTIMNLMKQYDLEHERKLKTK